MRPGRATRRRRRRTWLAAIMGALLLTAGIGLVVQPKTSDSGYVLAFGGDTFLGDRALDQLLEHGYGWALVNLPGLAEADLTVVNLEAPLVADYAPPVGPDYATFRGSTVAHYVVETPQGPSTRYVLGAAPAAAAALAEAGVDLAVLANNHSLDRGAAGLAETHATLAASGIAGIGAGATAAQAAQPHLVSTPFGTVAIVAFAKVVGTAPQATETSAGVHGLSLRNLMTAEREARAAGAKWVVASVHWGRNYEPVLPEQEYWAERFAMHGYDLVVGHGPHVAQQVVLVRGTPVIYSLGNLAFGMRGRWTEEAPGYGYVAHAVLTAGGFRELRLHCIVTGNDVVAYQPRPCGADESERTFARLGMALDLTDSVGILTW